MYSYYCMAQPSSIKSGNKINDTAPQIPQDYSTFPLSYRSFQTHHFAYITPHVNFPTLEGFEDSFRCMAETSSLSLNAPLKSDVYQKRTNFFVPLQAILPRNWEQIIVQPTNGDDVADNVNGVVSGSQLRTFLYKCLSCYNLSEVVEIDGDPDFGAYIANLIRYTLINEMFFSQGSLLKYMRIDLSHLLEIKSYDSNHDATFRSFDYFADHVLSALAPVAPDDTGVHSFIVSWFNEGQEVTDEYFVVHKSRLSELPQRGYQTISYDHFLDMARQNLNFTIHDLDVPDSWSLEVEGEEGEDQTISLSSALASALYGSFINSDGLIDISLALASAFDEKYNFNFLSAYQIICAHFFSNDYVDYIYSATLFRNLIQYYDDKIVSDASERVFHWNGIELHYDSLSGYYFNKAFVSVPTPGLYFPDAGSDSGYPFFDFGWCFLTALFSYRHNLRYEDYFTGGRTRPLSVGDVGVAVSAGKVNVVDIIQQKNAAKWLNWSQRIGRKFSDYIKGKTKIEPRPDLHDPQWLSGTGDLVFPDQVQNTGAAQIGESQSITSNLKSNTNRYQFKYMADRLGYIIGVTTYDIPRAYAFATGRDNYHANRFDIFNPMLQFNGSQAVKRSEIGLSGSLPFSYQGKYMEYKQLYDIVMGGFVERLPGFCFIADVQSGVPMQGNLNPSYIRSWNEELSPFYISLTGHTLAYRFNFIVKNTNIIQAHRNMEYQPQLM